MYLLKYPGLTSLILSLVVIPTWWVSFLGFSFINSTRETIGHWFFFPALAWVFAPGLLGISRLIYLWINQERTGLGIISIVFFILAVVYLYKFHTMRLGPAFL